MVVVRERDADEDEWESARERKGDRVECVGGQELKK
jgi:hypothetical protein